LVPVVAHVGDLVRHEAGSPIPESTNSFGESIAPLQMITSHLAFSCSAVHS
jgi:hypothetical protein